jgi:hypothetical protein
MDMTGAKNEGRKKTDWTRVGTGREEKIRKEKGTAEAPVSAATARARARAAERSMTAGARIVSGGMGHHFAADSKREIFDKDKYRGRGGFKSTGGSVSGGITRNYSDHINHSYSPQKSTASSVAAESIASPPAQGSAKYDQDDDDGEYSDEGSIHWGEDESAEHVAVIEHIMATQQEVTEKAQQYQPMIESHRAQQQAEDEDMRHVRMKFENRSTRDRRSGMAPLQRVKHMKLSDKQKDIFAPGYSGFSQAVAAKPGNLTDLNETKRLRREKWRERQQLVREGKLKVGEKVKPAPAGHSIIIKDDFERKVVILLPRANESIGELKKRVAKKLRTNSQGHALVHGNGVVLDDDQLLVCRVAHGVGLQPNETLRWQQR